MSLLTDEQLVKQPGDFLRLVEQNEVVLKSNAYEITTHWITSIKKSVLCLKTKDQECAFCEKGLLPRKEFYYFASVNGEEGIVRFGVKVIADLNNIERVIQKRSPNKDKRHFSWIVVKTGEGLETKYSVSKDEPVEVDEAQIKANNEKLVKRGLNMEANLEQRYKENIGEAEKIQEEPKEEPSVGSEDIPF